MQHIINKHGDDIENLIKNIDALEDAIKYYHASLTKFREESRLYMAYELVRIYSLLNNLLTRLIQNGHVGIANRIIAKYFQIPIEEVINPTCFYLIPNTQEGTIFCFENFVINNGNGTNETLVSLKKEGNKFFGTSETFHDILDFDLHDPVRFGAPDYKVGKTYYNLLASHLGVQRLLNRPYIGDCSGFINWYGSSLPIQPVITKELGITIPIIQSFFNPLQKREVKNVLIWQGFTDLSEAECMGVAEIFEKCNAIVTLLEASKNNKQDFFNNYTDDKYDLIWISCHGEFHHFDAHYSYLDLGNDIKITLPELESNKKIFLKRRLLVLGACDGATTALFNSPVSIGIGATMVSQSQSLISHTWPVDNYAGMIHGIILAIYLSLGLDYKTAHQNTILLFLKGKQEIYDFVAQYCQNPDVLERINNTSIEFDNFYYWDLLLMSSNILMY